MKRLDGRGAQFTPARCLSPLLRELWSKIDRPMEELAADMNLTRTAMYHWKMGRSCPNLLAVEELADLLGYELVLRRK